MIDNHPVYIIGNENNISKILKISYPVAKTFHQCSKCLSDILPGKTYQAINVLMINGKYLNQKTCNQCLNKERKENV